MKLATCAATAVFLLASCAPNTIEANPAPASPEAESADEISETATEEDSANDTAGESNPTAEPDSRGSSPDDPLPVGDASVSGFSYEDNFQDTSWDGSVQGLIATELGDYNQEEGTCYLLLGTLTPTAISEGSVTNGFEAPSVSAIAGGQQIQAGAVQCDTTPAEQAGYGWILDAQITLGTTYPFFAEIFLPGNTPPELETIVLGEPSTAEALYYEPTILDTPPAP